MIVDKLKIPKGIIFVLIGAFLISFSPVFVNLVDLEPTVSGFYRMFIGSIGLIIFCLIKYKKLPSVKRIPKYLIFAAIFFTLDLWFWHRSIIFVGPGLSTLLANLQVLILPFLALIFFKQPANRFQIISVFIGLIGLFLITSDNWIIAPDTYKIGIFFGVLTGFSYAGYLISMKFSSFSNKDLSTPVFNLLIISIISSLFLIAIIGLEKESLVIDSSRDFMLLFCYGFLSHVVGWYFILTGLETISAVTTGLILLSQPIFSYFWDVILFEKDILTREYFGIFIILLAMIICISSEKYSENRVSN